LVWDILNAEKIFLETPEQFPVDLLQEVKSANKKMEGFAAVKDQNSCLVRYNGFISTKNEPQRLDKFHPQTSPSKA